MNRSTDIGSIAGGLRRGAFVAAAAALAVLSACEKESPTEPPPPPGPAWRQEAPVNAPRFKAGALGWNGRIYLVGGGGSDIPEALPLGVEVYDPAGTSWEFHEDLRLFTLTGTVFVPYDGKLYAASGEHPGGFSRGVQVFDPAKMTIETVGVQLAEAHKDGGGVALPDGILVIGGRSTPGTSTTLVERIDPVARTVVNETRLPYPLQDFSAAYHDGLVFVFGGQDGRTASRVDSVAIYDPVAKSWEVVDNALPLGWEHPRAAVVDGRILVFSGKGEAGMINGEFDPLARRWSPLSSIPGARSESAVAVLDGDTWIISGFVVSGEDELLTPDVFVYDISAEEDSSDAARPIP